MFKGMCHTSSSFIGLLTPRWSQREKMRLRLHLLRLPSFMFSLQLNQSVKLTLTSSSAPQSDTPSLP